MLMVMTSVTTQERIEEMKCSLDYQNYKFEIETTDAQESYNGGVIVLVTGFVTGKYNQIRLFTQTFFLTPQETRYFVLKDVFRYTAYTKPDSKVGKVGGNNDACGHQTLNSEETRYFVLNDVFRYTAYTKPDSKVGKVGGNNDACGHRTLNSGSESSTSTVQEDSPKKSYASILSSQTKKGQMKVMPASSSKIAATKSENQPIDSAQAPPHTPEASFPAASSSFTEPGIKGASDEVECYSIRVFNLPPRVTVGRLRQNSRNLDQ